MADKLSPFKNTNGNTENGHESMHEEHDEPIERKRRRVRDDINGCEMENRTDESSDIETIKHEETPSSGSHNTVEMNQGQFCEPSTSFQSSTTEVNQKGDFFHIVEPIEPMVESIKTQTFWNSGYKNDIPSLLTNAFSVIQEYPTTKSCPSTSKGFSVSDMLEPEMEMIPISLSEATIQCPLCHMYFSPYEVEVHASTCMDKK